MMETVKLEGGPFDGLEFTLDSRTMTLRLVDPTDESDVVPTDPSPTVDYRRVDCRLSPQRGRRGRVFRYVP